MQGGYIKGSMIVLLLAFCFAVPTAEAVERCVLAELLTWVDCHPCTSSSHALDSLTQEYPDSSLAIIRYYPQASDPFYKQESYNRTWYYYYPNFIFPTAYFDGGMRVKGAISDSTIYKAYKDSIEVRLIVPSPVSIELSVIYDSLSRSGQAITQVTAVDLVEADMLYLRSALIESGLAHEGVVYNEVLRDMYPNDIGVSFAIQQGGVFRDTMDFTLDPLWHAENCDLVVFVQDDATKEVLQSIQAWIPLPQVPAAAEDVELALADSSLLLTWSPVTKDTYGHPLVVDYYRVYKNTSISVIPDTMALLDSTQALSYPNNSCDHVGDTQLNCYYCVTAVAGGLESSPSRIVGEYDLLVEYVK
jgi:hypothetical protein